MDLRLPDSVIAPAFGLPARRPRLYWGLCALGAALVFAAASRLPLLLAAAAAAAFLLVAAGVRWPERLRWTALTALFVVPVVTVLPMFQPQDYNYQAYLVGFAVVAAFVVVLARRAVPFDVGIAFFVYVLVSAAIFVGPTRATSSYATFLFPLGGLAFYVLAITSASQSAPLRVVRLFLGFATVEAGLGIVQSLTGWPMLYGQQHFISPRNPLGYLSTSISKSVELGMGTFMHPNGLGCIMTLALPLALGLWLEARRSPVRSVLVVLFGLGLWVSYSRAAWVGALFGIGLLVFVRSRRPLKTKLIVLAVGLCALAVVGSGAIRAYYSGSQNLTSRLNTWQEAKHYAEAKPGDLVFGRGYSFFQTQNEAAGLVDSKYGMISAHSWLVQAVIEFGVVGLVLFLLFAVAPLVRGVRHSGTGLELSLICAIAAFLLSQLLDNNLFASTGLPLYVLLAALLLLQRTSQRSRE
jgi:hypothetical protein